MIRRFLRRKAAPEVPEAELARRLTTPDYACNCCGTVLHAGSGIVWPEAPFSWKNPPEPAEDEIFDQGGTEIFTRHYARRDGDNLLRAYLSVPVKGTDASVFLGVWCSLKIGNHARFRNAQARGDADRMGDMPSWLYTQLPRLTGPMLTEGIITPYSDGRLPLYWITTEKHPFHAAQRDGMTAAEILEIYESFGRGDMVQHIKA